MAKAQRRKATVNSQTVPSLVREEPILDITTRDVDGRTPLHQAAWYGYTVTVRRMLIQQAEVDARDNMERTPGHWSAFKGYLDVVKMLVEHGADVNARDSGGRTLLTMAIIGKQEAVETFLRIHGATV